MKKIVTLIIITLALAANLALSASLCLAADAPALFQPVTGPAGGKLTLVGNLPRSDWGVIMGQVIVLVLAVTGSLAFAAFTYGGVMMVTAQGNEEQIRKGKNILFYSILALAIIAASYGIVTGISQLKFFQ
jgi:hypothetical protein